MTEQTDQVPVVALSGIEINTTLEPTHKAFRQTRIDKFCNSGGSLKGSSLVDTIIDDLQLSSSNRSSDSCSSLHERDKSTPLINITSEEITPPRGQLSSLNTRGLARSNPATQGEYVILYL